MATIAQSQTPAAQPPGGIPPLEEGARLTRAEFERRYSAMPHVKKAELIEGIVYMPSPVSHIHGRPHLDLGFWITYYSIRTPGTDRSDNGTVRLDENNEPQPDAQLFITSECGGQSRLVDHFIEGAPELAAEVSVSSASYDLHAKLDAYRRNGVREYVVWRSQDMALDWFRLHEGQFVRIEPGADAISRSVVFPGLWLDVPAMLRGDLLRVVEILDAGLASPEHAAFVSALAAARK